MGLSLLKRTTKEKEKAASSIDPPLVAEHSKQSTGLPSFDKITPIKTKQVIDSNTTSSRGGICTDDGTPDTAGLTPPALSPLLRPCPNTQEATPVRSNVNDNHVRGGDKDDGFEMVLSPISNDGNCRKYGAKHHHNPVASTQAKPPHSSTALPKTQATNLTGTNLTNLFNCASGDGDEKDDWDVQLESRNMCSEDIPWDDQFDSQNNTAVSSVLEGGNDDRYRIVNKKTNNETKFLRRLKRRNISKKSTSRKQQEEEINSSAAAAWAPPLLAAPATADATKLPLTLVIDKRHSMVPQFINHCDDDGSMPSNLTEPEITHRKTPSPRMVTPPSALLGPSVRGTNTSTSTMIMHRNRSLRTSIHHRSGGLPPPLVESFSKAEESTRGAESVTILSSLVSKEEETETNTVGDLLSLFRCNEDSTTCGLIPCEPPVVCGPLLQIAGGVSCLPNLMRKDAVEIQKEKEEKYALEFQRDLLRNGIKLIYHESPSHASPNPDWIQSTIKLFVRRGNYSINPHQQSHRQLQPSLVWAKLPDISRMKSFGNTADSSIAMTNDRNWNTLGLLDIHSVLADEEGGGENKKSGVGATAKTTSTGFFSITAANGAVFVFEAPTVKSRNYVVNGIKSITSRLVYHMIAGNVDGMNELYQSEESEEDGEMTGELPRLAKPWKALSRVVHGYLDQQ